MSGRERVVGLALLAYWPVSYAAFYIPWIVPRLPGWRTLPFWVLGFVIVFGLGLVLLGTLATYRHALAWAAAVGGTMALMNVGLGMLQAPGFVKHHDLDTSSTLLLFCTYILGCLVFIVLGSVARWLANRRTQ